MCTLSLFFCRLSNWIKITAFGNTKILNFRLKQGRYYIRRFGYGMVWYGMVWYGMVWYGMVWCGVVWCGAVRCDAVR